MGARASKGEGTSGEIGVQAGEGEGLGVPRGGAAPHVEQASPPAQSLSMSSSISTTGASAAMPSSLFSTGP